MGTRTTLQDVADAAGVTRGTASNALTGGGRVADATRLRVRETARQLGYTPNPTARRLRSGRSGAIGLYLPPEVLDLGFYMQFTFGVLAVAQRSELSVVLIASGAANRFSHFDGAVVVDGTAGDPAVDALLGTGAPVVAAEEIEGARRPADVTVRSDNAETATTLLDGFAAAGAKKAAIILPPSTQAWTVAIRRAYLDWCERLGQQPQVIEVTSHEQVESLAPSVQEAVRRHSVDAFLAVPEGAALQVRDGVDKLPDVDRDRIVFAAWGDGPELTSGAPSITAVDLRPRDLGERAAELLVQRLAADDQEPREPMVENFPLAVRRRASSAVRREPGA